MPGLRRATPSGLLLELTRQLAEQYDAIPLAKVSRVVKAAVATTTGPDGRWDGVKPDGMPALIGAIERLAREDLDHLREELTPVPAVRARPGARRSGPRRGVA